MTRAPVVAGFRCPIPPKILMEVKCHEGKTVCKADLREVQDHPPQGQGYGYLPEPEAQAEAGLNPYRGYPIPPIYETPGRRPRRLSRGVKSPAKLDFLRRLHSNRMINSRASWRGMMVYVNTTSTRGERGAAGAEAVPTLCLPTRLSVTNRRL